MIVVSRQTCRLVYVVGTVNALTLLSVTEIGSSKASNEKFLFENVTWLFLLYFRFIRNRSQHFPSEVKDKACSVYMEALAWSACVTNLTYLKLRHVVYGHLIVICSFPIEDSTIYYRWDIYLLSIYNYFSKVADSICLYCVVLLWIRYIEAVPHLGSFYSFHLETLNQWKDFTSDARSAEFGWHKQTLYYATSKNSLKVNPGAIFVNLIVLDIARLWKIVSSCYISFVTKSMSAVDHHEKWRHGVNWPLGWWVNVHSNFSAAARN